jgi:nitrite reductase/ring-hydroxylating ferredoxin subunit
MPVLKNDPFPVAIAGERALDRRRFLCAAGTAAVAVLAGEWIAARQPAARAGLVRLARADTPAIGEARALVAVHGAQALAVRLDADTLVAFERRCPHLGCPVVWSAARGRFECPCHRAVFEARTGRVLAGPPPRGLTPLALEVA